MACGTLLALTRREDGARRETGDPMANVRTGRKSGFITRNGVQRRETVWLQFPRASTSLAASATSALVYSLNAAALALEPFTIVRTRFQWLCVSDQSAATETFVGNFGLAVVSDQAVAIGVTAVPTPATDQGSDLWFLIEPWPGRFELIGTSINSNVTDRPIESKAMRKVDIGQDIVGVVEAGIGGTGTSIVTVGRMLVKLH